MSQRLRKTRHHLDQQANHKVTSSHQTHLRAIQSDPDADAGSEMCPLCSLEEVYAVIQRKPLRSFPMPEWVKAGLRICYAFMRWVNGKYGFAASDDEDTPKTDFHSIEIKGVYPNRTDAWHEANCEGGAVKPTPWMASVSNETCQYGSEDWPLLDGKTRRQYQHRKLGVVSFSRSEWERLEAKAEEFHRTAGA